MPRIVLAHNPWTIEHLSDHRCDLMLSGHTHGGQVKLPCLGRVTLGPKGRRFAAGLYRVRDSWLYVNKGVGFGFRVRYGVRPEVAVLTLAAGNEFAARCGDKIGVPFSEPLRPIPSIRYSANER